MPGVGACTCSTLRRAMRSLMLSVMSQQFLGDLQLRLDAGGWTQVWLLRGVERGRSGRLVKVDSKRGDTKAHCTPVRVKAGQGRQLDVIRTPHQGWRILMRPVEPQS